MIETVAHNLILMKRVPPVWGMWAPNIFLLTAGLLLYRYTAREREINWERLLTFPGMFRRSKVRRSRPTGRRITVRRRLSPLPILDGYVLRRLLSLFSLVFVSLMLIFYIINIFDLMDDIIENQVPFIYNLKFNFFQTPGTLMLVLPVTILTAVLLTFSLMSKNNEVTAVQVSGISLYRLTVPAFSFGLLVSGACFLIQEKLLPDSNRQALQCLDVIHKRRPLDDTQASRNWLLGNDGTIYFYNFFDPQRNRYINFNVLYRDKNGTPSRRLTFRSAYWQSSGVMRLENGFIRHFRFNAALGFPVPAGFKRVNARNLHVDQKPEDFLARTRYSATMNIPELRSYIRFLKEHNSDPTRFEAQLYYNYAFPLSSLVMVLIAVPFAFRMGNRGALFGIGLAVGISIFYWAILGAFNALGSTAVLSPILSAFAPLLLLPPLRWPCSSACAPEPPLHPAPTGADSSRFRLDWDRLDRLHEAIAKAQVGRQEQQGCELLAQQQQIEHAPIGEIKISQQSPDPVTRLDIEFQPYLRTVTQPLPYPALGLTTDGQYRFGGDAPAQRLHIGLVVDNRLGHGDANQFQLLPAPLVQDGQRVTGDDAHHACIFAGCGDRILIARRGPVLPAIPIGRRSSHQANHGGQQNSNHDNA